MSRDTKFQSSVTTQLYSPPKSRRTTRRFSVDIDGFSNSIDGTVLTAFAIRSYIFKDSEGRTSES